MKHVKSLGIVAVSVGMAIMASPVSAFASVGNLVAPTMPDATATYQSFGGIFSDGGTIALFVIGAAVALGAIVLVAKYGWATVRGWFSKAK